MTLQDIQKELDGIGKHTTSDSLDDTMRGIMEDLVDAVNNGVPHSMHALFGKPVTNTTPPTPKSAPTNEAGTEKAAVAKSNDTDTDTDTPNATPEPEAIAPSSTATSASATRSKGKASQTNKNPAAKSIAGKASNQTASGKESGVKEADISSTGVNETVAAALARFPLEAMNIEVNIAKITPCDVRFKPDSDRVTKFMNLYRNGVKLPNVILMRGKDGLLRTADGNHRMLAKVKLAKEEKSAVASIIADIYLGEQADAEWLGEEINDTHGKPLERLDHLHRLWKRKQAGENVNVSEFSRTRDIPLSTINLFLKNMREKQESADSGYAALAREVKIPKTAEQKAKEMAERVVKLHDAGVPVIDAIFDQLPAPERTKFANDLFMKYGG